MTVACFFQELVNDMLDARGVNSELAEYLSDVSFISCLLSYVFLWPDMNIFGQSRTIPSKILAARAVLCTKFLLWNFTWRVNDDLITHFMPLIAIVRLSQIQTRTKHASVRRTGLKPTHVDVS
jgi:hypothetical protein